MGTKLELTWIGKDQQLRREPRILLATPAQDDLFGGGTL